MNTPSEMSPEAFCEEYQAFIEMGLKDDEIARAFGMSQDALIHRLKRYKLR